MVGKVIVFSTGKLISVGTQSIKKSFQELKKSVEILTKNKFINTIKLKPKVRNICSTVIFEQELDLIKLARFLPHCIYEPDQFPGIIYRILNNLTALIFGSGKVVIVGAKNFEEINSSFFELNSVFKNHNFYYKN